MNRVTLLHNDMIRMIQFFGRLLEFIRQAIFFFYKLQLKVIYIKVEFDFTVVNHKLKY